MVGPYDVISTSLSMAGSQLDLGLDVHGIHFISLAARFRTATRSSTLADGLQKFEQHAAVIGSPSMPFSGAWKKAMLHRLTALSTMESHNFVCRLDRSSAIIGSSFHNMQKAATIQVCEVEQKRYFSRPTANQAAKVFGPISRHRIAPQIGCWDLSVDVQWSVYLEKVPRRRRRPRP